MSKFARLFFVGLMSLLVVTGCTDPEKEVPRLMQELRSSVPKTRSQAALALGRIGAPHATRAVPPLIVLLSDENPGVRSSVAYALRTIGGDAAERALDKNRSWGKK